MRIELLTNNSSRYRLLWRRSIHLTMAVVVEQRLSDASSMKDSSRSLDDYVDHLKWRLALNLHLASDHERALQLMDEVLRDDKMLSNKYDAQRSSYAYQVGGRCALQIFLKTQEHDVLETGYKYYKCAIENLHSMFHLPSLLLEFARVMEYYGAFEAAHDLYTRILTSFPGFRGYFNAFYRSAIVGRYLSSLASDPAVREESVNKCIDILQFLLEALPSDVEELHVLLLYGRTLEQSTNPQVKFRCNGVYKSLYEYCKKHRIAEAHTLDPPSAWFNDPTTWIALGDIMSATSEPLLAKDAYDKYVDLQQLIAKKYKSNASNSKGWTDLISIGDCIKLATNAAHFQNYPDAVKFCEIGLQKDRYHKSLRQLISKYSASHAEKLQHEVDSIYKILSAWKGRCWTEGFRRRLKEQVLAEYEQRYRDDRFDIEARQQLLYYAKDKYRPQLMFEEHCAIRLQRFSRYIRRRNMWLSGQLTKYSKQVDEAYSRYLRVPLNRSARNGVIDSCNVRIVHTRLAKHPIHRVKVLIEQQDRAVESLSRCYEAYLARKGINRLIDQRKHRLLVRKLAAARVIQMAVRRRLERKRLVVAQRWVEKRDKAVRVIQHWYRTVLVTVFHLSNTHPEKSAYRRRRAFQVLRKRLVPYIARFFGRPDPIGTKPTSGSKLFRASFFRRFGHRITMFEAYRRISRFVGSTVLRRRMHKAIMDIRKRNNTAQYSLPTTQLLGNILADESRHCYRTPGINPRGVEFMKLTQQQVIYCEQSRGFDTADCMMLSMVLRCKGCAVMHLVLHNLSNRLWEDTLLHAVRKSLSLRSLHIIGGRWSKEFFDQLFHIVQVDNSRIRCLSIDKVLSTSSVTESIATRSGCLLMDYFNYSIPGIQTLCLHGCGLTGGDLQLLSRGLEVNSSLESLVLSSNLIDDAGFIAVFCALYGNKKSKVMHLDLSQNLIKDSDHAIEAMLSCYRPISVQLRLVVLLISNPLKMFYVPKLTQNLQIVYNASDVIMPFTRDLSAEDSIHKAANQRFHQNSGDGIGRNTDVSANGLLDASRIPLSKDRRWDDNNHQQQQQQQQLYFATDNARRKVKPSKRAHTIHPLALHQTVT